MNEHMALTDQGSSFHKELVSRARLSYAHQYPKDANGPEMHLASLCPILNLVSMNLTSLAFHTIIHWQHILVP